MLPLFNSPPIGIPDTFEVWPGDPLDVGVENGLLANDMDMDGNHLQALLPIGSSTENGNLYLHPDGSFNYIPNSGYMGGDFFMYYLDDGQTFSWLSPVFLKVGFPTQLLQQVDQLHSSVFPNPGKDRFCIKTRDAYQNASLKVVDLMGRVLMEMKLEGSSTWIEMKDVVPGIYLFNVTVDQLMEQHRILIR